MPDSAGPSQDSFGPVVSATTVDAPRGLGLYADVSLHAKGGLGEVLRARDPRAAGAVMGLLPFVCFAQDAGAGKKTYAYKDCWAVQNPSGWR